MSDDETQLRLADIEDRMEQLQDAIESCRKGMFISRTAIIAGGIFFLVNLGLIAPPSLLIGPLSITAIIAGIVRLGANKTSREQARAALRTAQGEWQTLTDSIEMSTVGE